MFTPIDLDQIPAADRYFIYGASLSGMMLTGVLGALGLPVVGYFDSVKTGEVNHLPCRPPGEIARYVGPRDLLVIGSVHYLEIEQVLKAHGVTNYINGALLLGPTTHRELVTTKRFFERFVPSGCTVVDVGANTGDTAILFARRSRHVYGFEPNPQLHDQFASLTEAYDNVTLVPMAASDRPERLRLGLSEDMFATASSLHQASSNFVEVDCVALDDWCPENAVSPGFIKIDAEGHDAAVIAGARGVIERHRPIMLMETQGSERDRQLFLEMAPLYRVLRVALLHDPLWTSEYPEIISFYDAHPDHGVMMNAAFIPRDPA